MHLGFFAKWGDGADPHPPLNCILLASWGSFCQLQTCWWSLLVNSPHEWSWLKKNKTNKKQNEYSFSALILKSSTYNIKQSPSEPILRFNCYNMFLCVCVLWARHVSSPLCAPPPVCVSVWAWTYLSRRGRDAPPPHPALIQHSLFNTYWQHWKDLFCYVPSISLHPSLISGYSDSMFSFQLCNREKFPAETLAWTGKTQLVPPNPKVFPSADTEIPTCHSLLIWAAISKFKCLLNVTYEHSLVTVLLLCCLYI